MPKVSIVLPTYNRAHCIGKCIEAIRNQTFTDWELVICDDSQDYKTLEVVSYIHEARIKYYHNGTRLGLPANRNRGIQRSKAPLIWFVEDDVVVEPDCLEWLVAGFNNRPYCGAVGPRTIEPVKNNGLLKLESRISGRIKCQYQPSMLGTFTGLIYQNFGFNSNNVLPSAVLPSWSLFNRKVLEGVGSYDGKTYNRWNYSHEESDLFFRLRKAGFGLYFQPKAIAYHNHESKGGTRVGTLQYFYSYIGAHTVYLRRNYKVKSVYMIPSFLSYLAWEAICGIPALIGGL